jgi:hypothetical protein
MNTINRNAWHYKVWKKCGGSEKSGWGYDRHISLCGYVQRIFWIGLLFPIMIAFVASFVGMVLYHFIVEAIHHPMFVGSVVGGVLVVVAVFYWLINRPWSQSEEKELGVFGQWLKAKKDKVCPLLTFED